MFSLLLSSAYAASRPFALLTPPHQHAGTQGVGRGRSWDSWPQVNKGILHTICCHAQHTKLREEEGKGDVQSDGVWLTKLLLGMLESCLPGDGWALTFLWEAVNEFLRAFCLCWRLLLYPLMCLYVNPSVTSLLLFWFSRWFSGWGSEWVAVLCIVAGWG